jgi:hypothetical protein
MPSDSSSRAALGYQPRQSTEQLQENESSWIFEPRLTYTNALRRVQNPGFSLVARAREHLGPPGHPNPQPVRPGVTHCQPGCWPVSWALAATPSPAAGASTASSPGRLGPSSSPPTPQLAAKVHDVVGLYQHPPERAVVLCVDEKSQIQAVEPTQPVRRIWLGRPSSAP